jgi:hypothetical protein
MSTRRSKFLIVPQRTGEAGQSSKLIEIFKMLILSFHHLRHGRGTSVTNNIVGVCKSPKECRSPDIKQLKKIIFERMCFCTVTTCKKLQPKGRENPFYEDSIVRVTGRYILPTSNKSSYIVS